MENDRRKLKFTKEAIEICRQAIESARVRHSSFVTSYDLFQAIFKTSDSSLQEILQQFHLIPQEKVIPRLPKAAIGLKVPQPSNYYLQDGVYPHFNHRLFKIIDQAQKMARELKAEQLDIWHLVLALIKDEENLSCSAISEDTRQKICQHLKEKF